MQTLLEQPLPPDPPRTESSLMSDRSHIEWTEATYDRLPMTAAEVEEFDEQRWRYAEEERDDRFDGGAGS